MHACVDTLLIFHFLSVFSLHLLGYKLQFDLKESQHCTSLVQRSKENDLLDSQQLAYGQLCVLKKTEKGPLWHAVISSIKHSNQKLIGYTGNCITQLNRGYNLEIPANCITQVYILLYQIAFLFVACLLLCNVRSSNAHPDLISFSLLFYGFQGTLCGCTDTAYSLRNDSF